MRNLKASFIRLGLYLLIMTVLVNLAKAHSTEPVMNATFAPATKSVIVQLDHVNSFGATLTIQDLNGFSLHRENIQETETFAKKFNLKNLPDAEYKIIIEDNFSKLIQSININSGVINIMASENIIKPNFSLNANKLNVTFPQIDNNGYLFNIYDYNGNTIFKESNQFSEPTQRVYNLSELANGNYTAVLSQNGNNYSYEINLK